MDKMKDSGSLAVGSIPAEGTKMTYLQLWKIIVTMKEVKRPDA